MGGNEIMIYYMNKVDAVVKRKVSIKWDGSVGTLEKESESTRMYTEKYLKKRGSAGERENFSVQG